MVSSLLTAAKQPSSPQAVLPAGTHSGDARQAVQLACCRLSHLPLISGCCCWGAGVAAAASAAVAAGVAVAAAVAAAAEVRGDQVILREKGREITLRRLSPNGTWSVTAATPPTAEELQNPGFRVIVLTVPKAARIESIVEIRP